LWGGSDDPHFLSEIRVVTVACCRWQESGILLTLAPPLGTISSMINRGMTIDVAGKLTKNNASGKRSVIFRPGELYPNGYR